MLIERYDVEVFTPPCEPGAERFAAKAMQVCFKKNTHCFLMQISSNAKSR